MRHRLVTGTGLGNPDPCLLNNKWTENERLNTTIQIMLHEAIDLWFKDVGGVDFEIQLLENKKRIAVDFGIEPAYQYEKIKVFSIDTNKNSSYYMQGKAWGAYGSGIAKTTKYYNDYKYNSKFKRFVDKWSKELNAYV